MSLKVCIIIKSNSQKPLSAIVLYTNMAAVTSRENRELTILCQKNYGLLAVQALSNRSFPSSSQAFKEGLGADFCYGN